MPSLRLTFPENDAPSTVVLRGARLTVGRSPSNTLQIRDRTLSAQHAEFIFEDEHYRLHDLGATNGVLVNSEPVTDFHLREACEISFGGVVCQYSLETPEAADPADAALATHAECAALARENAELQQQNAAAQEELENLRRVHEADPGATVPQAEYDRLVEECATQKRALEEQARAFGQLRAEQGVLRRDRDNLQRALREAGTPGAGSSASVALPAGQPIVPVPGELPAPAAEPVATRENAVTVAAVPLATGPSSAIGPKPKPPFVPPNFRPTPAVPSPASAAPTPATAPRPFQPAARPVANLNRPPTANAVPRPLPGIKPTSPVIPAARPNLPGVRVVKPVAVLPKPAAEAGPKGTQKVSV